MMPVSIKGILTALGKAVLLKYYELLANTPYLSHFSFLILKSAKYILHLEQYFSALATFKDM